LMREKPTGIKGERIFMMGEYGDLTGKKWSRREGGVGNEGR